jgi:UDP-glucose 4-epimerase
MNKNILITGSSGFVGRNLIREIPEDWTVTATYFTDTTFPEYLKQIDSNAEPVRVNLSSRDAVESCLPLHQSFDLVYHLAANTNTDASVRSPEIDLKNNVHPFLNLLRFTDIERIIFLSSGAVYNQSFPYSVSKKTCEDYIKLYQGYGTIGNYTILRFFGAYGAYEHPRKIFSKMVKAFAVERQNTFNLRGDGCNLIDAMYIGDAVKGLLRVGEFIHGNVCCDFCGGNPSTINDLVYQASEIFGVENLIINHSGRVTEYNRVSRDNKVFNNVFDYEPETSLEVGIKVLEKWIKNE